MADEKATAKVTTPQYAGLDVDHPRIVDAIKQGAKRGMTKEQIQKVVGMPMEVVDKHFQNAK